MNGMFVRCLLLFALWVSLPTFAYAVKWKDVERELLVLNQNPFDPGSEALIVFNDGMLRVFFTGEVWWELTIYRRIKVFNKTGRDYATVTIPYLSQEKISDIRARVILGNGETIDMKSNTVADLPGPDRYGKIKRFTIPGVEDGSIIEYQYKTTSENIFYLYPWFFQGYDYTLSSTLTVTVPKEFEYKGGYVNLAQQPKTSRERWIDGRGTTYTWTVRNMPGVQEEPFSRPLKNRRGGMNFSWVSFNTDRGRFSILENWKDVDDIYREHYEAHMRRRGVIPAVVDSLTAGIDNPYDKVAAIYDYVQRNIRYTPMPFIGSTGNYSGRILARKRGESIDLTVLLCTMLDQAGIKAHPALIAPLDGVPFTPSMPTPVQFERLVTHVPVEGGEAIWLDPTFMGTPVGVVPWQNQGVPALVLDGSGAITRTPSTNHMNQEERELALSMKADGTVSAEGSITATGEMATGYRRGYAYGSDDDREQAFRNQFQRYVSDVSLSKLEFNDQTSGAMPVTMAFSFQGTGLATAAGNRLLVSPAVFGRIDEEVLPDAERTSTVYVGPVERTLDRVTLVPPEGYVVESMPTPVLVRAPFGRFMARYKKTPEGVLYTRQYALNHASISVRLYRELRSFFNRISESDQQQVVLVEQPAP
ncbi:MAG: DUF3857 and transglutaminase domain-containing protein [Gemmatimonadota bacterium]|nr:DUF3857 and transglutaminase domain-containing protein [Gemmatimonadota bacterium]